MWNQVKEQIREAELVLVGIGEELSVAKAGREAALAAYNRLAELLEGKDFFLVTLNTDDLIYASTLPSERIVAPCGSEAAENVVTNENYDESGYLPQWQAYTKWLENTLHRKLCILELGVGFQYPQVIRFAFEKAAYFNQKSSFVRVHSKLAQLVPELKDRGISVQETPADFLMKL